MRARQDHRLGKQVLMFLLGALLLGVDVDASDERPTYQIGPGDILRVTVFGHEDLSGEFPVDGSGYISLPLIGEVSAEGNTIREMAAVIADRLRPDYLKNPRVGVEVQNYRPFYILGEVNNPGSYPFVDGMSLINAIALAGGYTRRAREDRVLIIRRSDPSQQERPAGPETVILPGDVIKVPERFF